MSKGNTTENDFMKLIFTGVLPSYFGTLTTSGSTSYYLALHTADPLETGIQTTSEAAYTNYKRVEIARSDGEWTVSNNQATNTTQLSFPLCGGGSAIVSHVSLGILSFPSGGQILYSGVLNANRTISDGIQPQFSPGDLIFEED